MSFWSRLRTNRFIVESLILLVSLWVLLSIILWTIVGRLNELGYANQQEVITNAATSMLEDIEQSILSLERFFEASTFVTEEEFSTYCDGSCDDEYWAYILYAGDGVVDYAFPEGRADELVGTDLYVGFDDAMLQELQSSIDNQTLFYQEQDGTIIFYKAIVKDDMLTGIIAIAVIKDGFVEALGTSVATTDIVYELDDISFTSQTENDFAQISMETISIGGLEFRIGTNYASGVYKETVRWSTFTLLAMTVLLSVIFILLYRYQSKHLQYMEQMNFVKYHHIDTGLKNKESLYEDFLTISQSNQTFFVAYGLFNNLKFIHYKFGHSIGSGLELKAIRLIEGVLRAHSALYHLGGDEYIFLFNTDSKNEVHNILKRVLRVFEREIVIKNIRTNISLSLGVVEYPKEGKTMEELIQNASMTLSQSSIRSTNNYAFFSSIIHQDMVSLHDFDNYVNTLDLHRFHLAFMPIATCNDNTIHGFECLTRAYNEFNEIINTGDVINSLERTGRIQELDTIVFSKVINYKKQLNRDFPDNKLFLSVNASALSVNEAFVDTIVKEYMESDLPDGSIILELTESYKVEDYEYLIRLFNKLNTAGIRTAIDDFGSGYSSLSYISRFPVYSIKLDKTYVKNYDDSKFNRTLFFTMRSIAEVLDCVLIAEGVDDPDTLDFLRQNDCPMYQGYLLSKGVEFAAALTMYKQSLKE